MLETTFAWYFLPFSCYNEAVNVSLQGKEYAMNHLTAFVGILASRYEWTHHVTPKSEEITFLPTIFPADDCIVQIRKSVAAH